jgi:hypothetical protein
LFVGGIGESVFFPTQPQVSELEWQFERYANATGCSGTTDQLQCLRSKDTIVLQAANIPSPYPGSNSAPNFYWTPTIDGDFIQDYPYRLIEQGKFVKVPIIFGGKAKRLPLAIKNSSDSDLFKTTQMKVQFSQSTRHLQQMSQPSCRTTIPT